MPRSALKCGTWAIVCAAVIYAIPADAASCGGSFDKWLAAYRQEAAKAGVSDRTLGSALQGIAADPKVLALDRDQKVFQQSFQEFSGRMVSPSRLKKGGLLLLQHASMLSRIETQFGVPPEIIVAIWGLESDFGANIGKFSTIRSLATLAHDCRRSERFTAELTEALRIVERGDLAAADMRGAWAGEIGQTQFLPSSYVKFAVDFDGNGRRDLIRSVPDVLASTANYLNGHGWERGQPWSEGSRNYQVLLQWNKSDVYTKTVAYFAQRLAAGS